MSRSLLFGLVTICVAAFAVAGLTLASEEGAAAEEKVPAQSASKSASSDDAAKTSKADRHQAQEVEFFQAMKDDVIEVKFIAKSDEKAQIILKNNTKQPVNVKLPDAFAGVPVKPGLGPVIFRPDHQGRLWCRRQI